MMEATDQGVPVDGLVERAMNVSRSLSEAAEVHEAGTERLLNAYQNVCRANSDLSEDLQAKESALAAAMDRASRLEAEVERMKGLAREAVQAVKTTQAERDQALDAVRVSRENYDRLNATHNQLIETNARLTGAFEKMLTDVGSGSRAIRDGSRRLSDLMVPTPARPRAPRPPAQAAHVSPAAHVPAAQESQMDRIYREVGDAALQAATPRQAPRLVAVDGGAAGDPDDLIDHADRREVDAIMDGFGRSARA